MPFLLLGILGTVLGLLAARIVTVYQLASSETTHVSADLGLFHVSADLGLFLIGALGFLALLAALSFGGLLLIRRESILELVQEKPE